MIELPALAVPNGASPGLIDFGGFLTPGLGGRVQRINRLGNRFKIAVSYPPLPADGMGRIVVSRLIRGKTEGVRIEMPLLYDPGIPGQPRVNGGGQAGRTLVCDGFAPNYSIREGQWFSHEFAGGRCLYNVDQQLTLSNTGTGTINLSPMLRVQPADNDVLNFTRPMIEGFVKGEEWRWEMSLEHNMAIQFEIEEFV